jgi:hypothetical protein
MGEGSLLLRALHEHRDRRPDGLIDKHHENLVLVAKEDRGAAAHRGYREEGLLARGQQFSTQSLEAPPKDDDLSAEEHEDRHGDGGGDYCR